MSKWHRQVLSLNELHTVCTRGRVHVASVSLKKTLQEVLDRDYQNCLHRPKRDGNWANFQSELKSDDSCYVSKSVYQFITGDNTYSENRQFTKIQLIVRNECSFCCHLRETYVNTKHPTTFNKKPNANARFENLKIQLLWLPPFVLNI